MRITTACPPTDELQQLLEGTLVDQRQAECTEHLDSCGCCQAKLEEIATGGTNLSQVVEKIHEADPLATSAYWPALKALDRNGEPPVAVPPSPRIRNVSLDFLQPSTDGAYLGRLAHFDVMRVLGRGGMGVVLEAFDSKLQRHVAIKVLDPDLANDDLARQRFCREARAAASVTHENVVAVHQVERSGEEGLPYLVMQLIAGETLEQRLKREKKLPIKEIVRIGMQAARGLAAAHAQGLIHRDVKPGNILLEPPQDRVKLTDFGLARIAEDVKLTSTGFVTGTPLYMAPEQAMGEQADPRSDLFSLGAILYEISSGQTPFTGNSALAILKQITEVKHRPLRELDPEFPEWLAETIDDLLAKKPADRYQTATDLAEVLEYHWAHLKTSSDELAAVCQVELKRRSSRNKLLLGIIGTAVLAAGLLGGVLFSGIFLPARGTVTKAEVSSAEPIAVLSANAGTVWSVSFDPTSQTVAMGVEDGSVRLWDLPSKSVKATIDAHRGIVWAAQFSSDGQFLATAGDDGRVKLWKPPQSDPAQVFEHPNAIRGLAVGRDGKLLFAGDRSGKLHVWSSSTGKSLAVAEQPKSIYAVAISPDGETLATAGNDNIVRLWNAKTLAQKLLLTGHVGPINGISFGRDGKALASVGWDKTIRIWDVGSGLVLKSWPGGDGDLWAVTFSPDGTHLATAGQVAVKLWEVDTGKLLGIYLGHKTTVHTVSFNQDGSLLASGGRDGSARIWKVK
jgi:eukaryotic-like serine/threonine-protein kinase